MVDQVANAGRMSQTVFRFHGFGVHMVKIGEKIDDYEILEFPRHEASGSVYKSRHPLLLLRYLRFLLKETKIGI